MRTHQLQIDQLEAKIKPFTPLRNVNVPPLGWIRTIRLAFGMSLHQLGNHLSMTKQSVGEIENREKDGSITLKSLREVGKAMDMELVYGFVPKDGSIDELIYRKAFELASKIVLRTSNTMKLEDQQNSKERIEKAIVERATQLKQSIPKILWD